MIDKAPRVIPDFLSHLTVYKGLPVPFFTAIGRDGNPDFRAHSPKRHSEAIRGKLCGICGKRLVYWQTLVVGPKELESRMTYMPAMHDECARYAMSMCPFLVSEEHVMRSAAEVREGRRMAVTDKLLPKPTKLAVVRTSNYRIVYGVLMMIGHENDLFAPLKHVEWHEYRDGKLEAAHV